MAATTRPGGCPAYDRRPSPGQVPAGWQPGRHPAGFRAGAGSAWSRFANSRLVPLL
jgi:hypothetical protein